MKKLRTWIARVIAPKGVKVIDISKREQYLKEAEEKVLECIKKKKKVGDLPKYVFAEGYLKAIKRLQKTNYADLNKNFKNRESINL